MRLMHLEVNPNVVAKPKPDVSSNTNSNAHLNLGVDSSAKLFRPPLSASDSEILTSLSLQLNSTKSQLNSTEILDALSQLIEKQLRRIQNSPDCLNGGYTLRCGHNKKCGFGCEFHHRAACLALSYSMGIPLIHDLETLWPFSDPWEEAFAPLGSTHCPANNKTIQVTWQLGGAPFLYLNGSVSPAKSRNKKSQFPFAMKAGVPLGKELGLLVQKYAKDPFLWVMSQFIKYTMKLSEKQEKYVDDTKKNLGLSRSEKTEPESDSNFSTGFQIRRTDKKSESKGSAHPIQVYMKEADKYFQKRIQNLSPTLKTSKEQTNSKNVTRTVFIASEDLTVLSEARDFIKSDLNFLSSTASSLSQWKIVGVESNKTQKNQQERSSHLRDIVRDIVILSDCDFVVCGFSSNICRLVLEILSYKDPESFSAQRKGKSQARSTRLMSLDGGYIYQLFGFVIPSKLILVDT